MEKRWESWSGSSSFCSRLSIIRDSRSISGTLRRDRLMNIALRLLRSCASVPASRTASGVDLVERAGDAADLVGGLHADRLDVAEAGRVRLGQVGPAGGGRHPRGQPDRGDLERVRLQPAQRVDHRPGDERGRQQHQQHHGHGHHARSSTADSNAWCCSCWLRVTIAAASWSLTVRIPLIGRGHVGEPAAGGVVAVLVEPSRPSRLASGKMMVGSPAALTRVSISCADWELRLASALVTVVVLGLRGHRVERLLVGELEVLRGDERVKPAEVVERGRAGDVVDGLPVRDARR